MKKFVFMILVAFVGFSVQAQQAEIKFQESVIDYGTISKGSDGVRTFHFTNTGDAPLIIANIKSSCGCTVPKKPKGPIAPGESSTIEVKYDTNRVGRFTKGITVQSNASNAVEIIQIKGEVKNASSSVLERS